MAEVKYKPLNADITLYVPKVSDKTAGGIIKSPEMLEADRAKFTGALKVIHTGPNVPKDFEGKPQIIPGDKVLLRDGALLAELKIQGMELQQTDSYNVLGVIGR